MTGLISVTFSGFLEVLHQMHAHFRSRGQETTLPLGRAAAKKDDHLQGKGSAESQMISWLFNGIGRHHCCVASASPIEASSL